ncbi:MAG TPA: hypothetical protein VI636_06325 [Candidatus Angelobacter sp.]
MTTMREIRKRFIVVLAVLATIDAGLVTYLLWPGSNTHAEEQQLQQQFMVTQRQVGPLKGIDKKLEDTRAAIKTFYGERVLAHWSQISNELHKLAQENGVSLQAIKYNAGVSSLSNLQTVTIETGIAGDYLKIVRFINALERDKLLFVINVIALRGQTGGTVELQISFETFLKEAA